MDNRTYLLVSGGIFAFVSVVHLFRLIDRTPFIMGSWHLPPSLSVVGCVLAGFLSYQAFVLAGVIKKK